MAKTANLHVELPASLVEKVKHNAKFRGRTLKGHVAICLTQTNPVKSKPLPAAKFLDDTMP